MILALLSAAGLFGLGLYLSAVFSGSETAFYRVSTLRLTFDAAAGDRRARRLLSFARRPARFVATTLVGNNVANYLTTAAVGVAVGAVAGGGGGIAEVLATWAIAPVVFVCGELLPKQLCYLAPSHFLTKAATFLRVSAVLSAPVAVPLAALARLLEREGGGRAVGGVLGRGQLTEVLGQGKEAGLLTDAQDRLVETVLRVAPGAAADRADPPERCFTLPVGCTREDVLREAGRLGVREVLLVNGDPAAFGGDGPAASDPRWFAGYVRVAEVAADDRPPRLLVRPLPLLPATATKLEALVELRRCGEAVCLLVVAADTLAGPAPGLPAGRVLGVLRDRALVRELFGPG